MLQLARSFSVALCASASLALALPASAQAPRFVKETAPDLPGHNVWRPADLATRTTPVPVITWANGGCAATDFTWATLFERWAGEGFLVLTISKPEEAAAAMARARAAAAAPPGQPASSSPAAATAQPVRPRVTQVSSAARTAADEQAKALDWAEKVNTATGSPYAGKIDTARFAAAGNSCGGISSLNLASRDPRVKSVFVLSGSSVGPGAPTESVAPIMGKVTVPAIWVVGGPEDVARAAADLDFSLQPAGVPGAVIFRASMDHRTVSTDAATLREVAEMGVNWFRATLLGDAQAAGTVAALGCSECSRETWTVKAKGLAVGR